MDIRTSIHGKRLGFGPGGELVVNDHSGNQRILASGSRVVDVTASTLTVTADAHEGRTITLNRAAGIAVTLPASTGGGARYRFVVGTAVTSNSTAFSADGTDTFQGNAFGVSDGSNAVLGWKASAGADNTFTMDGSTKGGLAGDIIEFEDVASGTWNVSALIAQTGTEATPFSTV